MVEESWEETVNISSFGTNNGVAEWISGTNLGEFFSTTCDGSGSESWNFTAKISEIICFSSAVLSLSSSLLRIN